jgi:diaminohydroxyphosphoribosylaminopyrimidine deaminase/5-amino-6-(5-phosphoribosylamino)uracil reductase
MASHALPVYVAPSLLGDDAAAMFGLAAPATFGGRTRLAFHDVERIGPALRILARLASAVWHTRITGEPWCWSR